MTLQVSPATQIAIADVIYANYNGGIIKVYGGPRPANAALPAPLSQIGYITNGGVPPGFYGSGLSIAQIGNALVNDALQEWILTPTADGIISFFRFCGNPLDDGLLSATEHRFDGDAGVTTGHELILPSLSISFGSSVGPISMYYAIPSSL